LFCINGVCSESFMSIPTSTSSLVTPTAKKSIVIVAGVAVAALIGVAVLVTAIVWICCRRRARQRQQAAQAGPAQANTYAFQQPLADNAFQQPAAPPYKSPYPPGAYPASPFLGSASPAPSYISTAGPQKQAWPIQTLPPANEQTFELDSIPNKNSNVFELDGGDSWSPLESEDPKRRK
jgi:hypothetical protein